MREWFEIEAVSLTWVITIFFYSHRVVHKEFVPPSVTVNQKYLLKVLDCLRNRVIPVRMEIAG